MNLVIEGGILATDKRNTYIRCLNTKIQKRIIMIKFFSTVFVAILVITIAQAQSTSPIDAAKSTVTWTGNKVTGSHTGTINISEGSILNKDGRFHGGSFTIDMTSIANTDLGDKMRAKLEGHLKSDDFFGVETYPMATLTITDVKKSGDKYELTADLTLKGKTAPVTFDAMVTGNTATANITIDRTVYDVKYGSGKFFEGLGDKMISDDFELVVSLVY
jgi:polyisoprenoid-binding protein YceI